VEELENICLDSDFLIKLLRNQKEEVAFIKEHRSRAFFATTFINLFELYLGAYKSGSLEHVRHVYELQDRLILLNLSEEAVRQAGQIGAELEKKGLTVESKDLLIACIAQTEGFGIKTNNKKHFERIGKLHLFD